jgi:protein phosphatase
MLTPEEAAASDLQSVITRAIGISKAVDPDFFAVDLNLDDLMLLTTDGLTRYAQPEDIARITAAAGGELAAMCHDLIDHAKQGGGVDNITCMMLRVVEAAPAAVAAEEVELSPPALEL